MKITHLLDRECRWQADIRKCESDSKMEDGKWNVKHHIFHKCSSSLKSLFINICMCYVFFAKENTPETRVFGITVSKFTHKGSSNTSLHYKQKILHLN